MLRSLAILAVSLSACSAGQAQSTYDVIHLRATVQAVIPLTSFSGRITPVDVDPRFALTVRIESTVPAVPNFTEGALVTFAIHSPSLLFAGEPTKSRTYDFLLRRKIENGKVSILGLSIRAINRPGQLLDRRQVRSCVVADKSISPTIPYPLHSPADRTRIVCGTARSWRIKSASHGRLMS